jgi:hypothetical protein
MAAELDIWRAVFDVAVSSMNFGSGFLDDEEVRALRAAAVLLGVDPDTATPDNFICKYRGHHRARVILENYYFDGPDGIPRNAYRDFQSFPADVRRKLKCIGNDLALLPAPVIAMTCDDCHCRWHALDPVPGLDPLVVKP